MATPANASAGRMMPPAVPGRPMNACAVGVTLVNRSPSTATLRAPDATVSVSATLLAVAVAALEMVIEFAVFEIAPLDAVLNNAEDDRAIAAVGRDGADVPGTDRARDAAGHLDAAEVAGHGQLARHVLADNQMVGPNDQAVEAAQGERGRGPDRTVDDLEVVDRAGN